MQTLNEAYEVLTTPGTFTSLAQELADGTELRQRYDNGDDPNDPHSGQQQNPFAHHGGNPFQFFQQGAGGFPFPGGGGGQRVKFEF
jgi:DnaJ family protein C protein 3